MLPDKVKDILTHEGPVGIVTAAPSGEPHLVGTWNSYVHVVDDKTVAYPAGRMRQTESNVQSGSRIQLLVATRGVNGKNGKPGAGFRLAGKASFETDGSAFDALKERFGWCRAAVVVTVDEVEEET